MAGEVTARWPRAIAGQLARALAVVIAVSVLATALGECAPGTAGERAARAAGVMPAADAAVGPEQRAALARRVARDHDLDRPLAARLGAAAAGSLVLDFGDSWVDRRPVRGRVLDALPRTLALVVLALVLALAFGIATALVAARRPGGTADLIVSAAAAVAISLPPVWLGMILLRTLATGHPLAVAPVEGLSILPVVALAVVPAFVLARHARAALMVSLAAPWAIAERARGASEDRVVRHALRVQVSELMPLAVSLVAYLFGAAVVIEELFGIPGLGRVLLDAAGRGDQPTITGACAVLAGCIALVSAAADLLGHAADPRRRDAP